MIILEFSTFLGRFHPVMVHLPIGFLVLAIVLELIESFRRTKTMSGLIPIAWLLGGLSAAVAALCGWYLGETGLYEEDILFVHRWLGIALVIISFAGYFLKRGYGSTSPYVQHGFNLVVLGMLFYEGHQGGNMTHGETYLTQYAPPSVKNLLGAEAELDSLPEFGNPDSVLLYADLVEPILKVKCFACHNNEVQRGGLNMASPDSLVMGSQGDPILVGGSPMESELFKRLTLPHTHIKFMPPTENPLTYNEVQLVEWWIETGASFEDAVASVTVSENIKPVLMRRYALNTEPRPWYETVQLPRLEDSRIEELKNSGFVVKTLGATNPLLDVSYEGKNLTEAQLKKLEEVSGYVTWLSLGGTNVKNEWLSTVAKLENLTRLELEKTDIGDEGVALLPQLKHLEALNLYGTKVTDASLIAIEKMANLKRVYLWNTQVSPQVAENTREKKEGLEIVMGN